jgi:hypothetical protein
MRRITGWKHIGATALIYLGLVVALAAIGAGVFYGGKSYLDGVDARGFARGQQEAETKFLARDNAALAAATQRIRELQERVRASEAQAAADVATIDKKHQEELTNARRKASRDIADARSGALRLRDHWRDQAASCTANGGGSADSTVAGASGSGDDTGGTVFSREAVELLLGEANRADSVRDRLHAAQALIRKYLEIVNGRN